MGAAQATGRPSAAPVGVVMPPHLAKLAATLIEHGINDLTHRNGGSPAIRHLAELRRALAAAASGTPSATLEPRAAVRSYTTAEAASVMRLSQRRVRHLAATGRLIAVRRGRDWQIDWQSAEDYRRPGRTR